MNICQCLSFWYCFLFLYFMTLNVFAYMYRKSENTQSGPPWQCLWGESMRLRVHKRCMENPIKANMGFPLHYILTQACQSGQPMPLHFEPRHTGFGLKQHYISFVNTPAWTSQCTIFEPYHIGLGLPWHYMFSLNALVLASHGTTFWD